MKAYRLKITCFILLLLPVLTCCTDEELLRGSGVPEGVPTTVDISVGTAANRAKTRSGLPEGEERKIYNLYLWVFDSRGGVEFSRSIPVRSFIRPLLPWKRQPARRTRMHPRAWDC